MVCTRDRVGHNRYRCQTLIVLIAAVALFFAIDPFFDSRLGEASMFVAGLLTIIVILWFIATLL